MRPAWLGHDRLSPACLLLCIYSQCNPLHKEGHTWVLLVPGIVRMLGLHVKLCATDVAMCLCSLLYLLGLLIVALCMVLDRAQNHSAVKSAWRLWWRQVCGYTSTTGNLQMEQQTIEANFLNCTSELCRSEPARAVIL